MERMNLDSRTMVVLDHHKTAEADCAGLRFCQFDMERSGCRMAWDWFFDSEPCPEWIKRVEDRDLWRFSYPDTAEVHAFIASYPMTMANWDELHAMEIEDIEIQGEAIRRYIDTYIEKAAKEARGVILNGDSVVVLNIPYQNASETASYLLEYHSLADYAMSYFQRGDGRWQYSLRSRSEFDVSEVAKRYGGGGHAQAAGFDTEQLIVPTPEPPDA
jgi:nanoRNase/pAp phosphatase (c-di-AMP/oligoRNAs hydrolase)